MRLIPRLVGAAALAITLPAQAAGFADPSMIDLEVSRFTGAGIGTPGGARLPVDRRLKLAGCDAPLALDWYGPRRDTVLVRCPMPDGWRIYVPVDSGAPGAARQDVAVAKGDNVSITLRGHGFSLSRQGEALEAGAVGQWIRVRPASSGTGADTGTRARNSAAEPIRARVLRPGAVGTELP